jgi:hypothetical protein
MRGRWLMAMLVCGMLLGCRSAEPPELPPALHGVWTTPHEKYADIHFELQPRAVVLHAGGGHYQSHAITAVQAQAEQDVVLYRVGYRHTQEHSDLVLAFYYYRLHGGVIRFKSQQDIAWRKEAPAP